MFSAVNEDINISRSGDGWHDLEQNALAEYSPYAVFHYPAQIARTATRTLNKHPPIGDEM